MRGRPQVSVNMLFILSNSKDDVVPNDLHIDLSFSLSLCPSFFTVST